MADDPINDEYQYTEVDPMNPSPLFDKEENIPHESLNAVTEKGSSAPANVKRNALIAVGFVVFFAILYTFLKSSHDVKTPIEEKELPSLVVPGPTEVKLAPPISEPASTMNGSDLEAKLENLEASQDSFHSDLTSINGQVTTMSDTLGSLSEKMNLLNTTLTNLTEKLEAQSHEIERLTIKSAPPVVRSHVHQAMRPTVRYALQAVIPGRAWLVASNGTTLTVRKGSTIPGYGLVKLIDAIEGRVFTSSRQVIRFSQDDS